MKRSQKFGIDYGMSPLEKWKRPLICVAALASMFTVYGGLWYVLDLIL